MRTKNKHSRIFRRCVKIICCLLILFIGFFCLFEFKARHLVHNLVENELEIHAMNSIDNAVCDVLNSMEINYNSLVISNTDTTGRVNSLQTDTKAINILKAEISKRITDNIRNSHTARIGVPMGAFTGIVLISSMGPDLFVTLTLDGSVTTTIKSEFSSAGINQTIHRVYLVVDADVSLTCPIISYDTSFITEYELCQTVIVGSTPQMFANIS